MEPFYMQPMTEIAHDFLLPALHRQALCVDATLGYGHDTDFFLDHHVKRVFAYDIAAPRIEEAKLRYRQKPVSLFAKSHACMEEDLKELAGRIDAVIFNFGYDPRSAGDYQTVPETSLQAVLQACRLLKRKGRLALVFYHHQTGLQEAEMIEKALLAHKDALEILKVQRADRETSPHLLLMEKRHEM
jgi:16S rRNA C1402 N4-methylase RsmH